jgi:hypothetical protein
MHKITKIDELLCVNLNIQEEKGNNRRVN